MQCNPTRPIDDMHCSKSRTTGGVYAAYSLCRTMTWYWRWFLCTQTPENGQFIANLAIVDAILPNNSHPCSLWKIWWSEEAWGRGKTLFSTRSRWFHSASSISNLACCQFLDLDIFAQWSIPRCGSLPFFLLYSLPHGPTLPLLPMRLMTTLWLVLVSNGGLFYHFLSPESLLNHSWVFPEPQCLSCVVPQDIFS